MMYEPQQASHWHAYDISMHFVVYSLLSVTDVRAVSISPVMKNDREWGIVFESEIKLLRGGNIV